MAVAVAEGLQGKAATDLLLIDGVDIERVAKICADSHPCLRQPFGQQPLAVAEAGPRRAVKAAELNKIEGQRLGSEGEGFSPALLQQRKEACVQLAVVGITLTLVPNYSL